MATRIPRDLRRIAERINAASARYEMGRFQDLRAEIKGRRRAREHVFDPNAPGTFAKAGDWAYHYGGRTELQFNIGLEERGRGWWFRYGVAFSLEPSRSLPDPSILLPHILRYNAYMRSNGSHFTDMSLWYYGDSPSRDLPGRLITDGLLTKGHFFFLGKRCRAEQLDIDSVLQAFDRLLELYLYVEEDRRPTRLGRGRHRKGFALTPRELPPVRATTASRVACEAEVAHRHHTVAEVLLGHLRRTHGKQTVGPENPTGHGTVVDMAVKTRAGLWFYEIKAGSCVRLCIREGLSQLLEYAFWHGNVGVTKLVIVGETPTDAGARRYLHVLRNRFRLPVYYSQVDCEARTVGAEE